LNGKELWSIKPNYQMLSMSNPSIIDSLLIIGDFDYKKNIGNHLTCINIDKQMILWQIENKGYINSPAIIESKSVIFNSDSAYQKGYTYKADLLNGDILWKTKTSPVIHYESKKYKNKIFVPSYENGIICLNNDT